MICAAIAVFVATYNCRRIQLQKHRSSIRTNRADGVAILEGSPIRYNNAILFRIELPSNTATMLRYTNRAAVFL